MLTGIQRQAWSDWGAATTFPARVVPGQHLKGNAAFVLANTTRVQAGFSIIDDGPVVNSLLNWTLPFSNPLANGDSNMEFTLNVDDEWQAVGGFVSLYVGPPQNPAVNFFRGPFQFQDFVGGGTVGLASGTFTLAAPIATAVGNKIPWRMVASGPDGRPGQAFNGVLIVAG